MIHSPSSYRYKEKSGGVMVMYQFYLPQLKHYPNGRSYVTVENSHELSQRLISVYESMYQIKEDSHKYSDV